MDYFVLKAFSYCFFISLKLERFAYVDIILSCNKVKNKAFQILCGSRNRMGPACSLIVVKGQLVKRSVVGKTTMKTRSKPYRTCVAQEVSCTAGYRVVRGGGRIV